MQDSLYGFKFKSRTSLLVGEIDEVDMEPTQWQESRQQEPRNTQSPHKYCDEATQTPNWEHQEQHSNSLTSAPQTVGVHEGQSQPEPWIEEAAIYARMAKEAYEWRRQLALHEAALSRSGYCPSPPTPQHIRPKHEVSDESMQMFPEFDPFEAGDGVACDDFGDSIADQDVEREGDSDASSVTMEDVCANNGGAVIRRALHPDDEIGLDELEDESVSSDSEEDVVSGGSTAEQLRQLLYEANGGSDDMCE